MAEISGTRGVQDRRSSTASQDPGEIEQLNDVCERLKTIDNLLFLYEVAPDPDLLDEAIERAESAIAAMAPSSPNQAIFLAKLCEMWGRKYESTGDVADLDMAWMWGMEEIDKTPGGVTTYSTACSSILTVWRRLERAHGRSETPGEHLFRRFERLSNVDDLQQAISEIENAVGQCPPGGPAPVDLLDAWVKMLVARFERIGDPSDLEKAISHCEEALAVTPQGNPNRAVRHDNLWTMLATKFNEIGDLGDLQNAIKHCEEAHDSAQQDDPDRADRLSNLGAMFYTMFKMSGELGDLQKAIKHSEEVLSASPHGHPDRVTSHCRLGDLFHLKFERGGDLRDLDKAIKYSKEGLASAPQDHPVRAELENNLGNILFSRFERIGELRDIQEAIQHGERALAATPQDSPRRAPMHHNLANSLSGIFERIADLDDLQRAIKHGEKALAASSQNYGGALMHNTLGLSFLLRFERIGDLCDLSKAIKHVNDALSITPQDHPGRAGIQNNLALMFYRRFGRIGDLGDLQKAIENSEEALSVAPGNHASQVAQRNNLGLMFTKRFERRGDLQDLQQAIKCSEEVLAATPQDHAYRGSRHNLLGNNLAERFERIGDIADLQKSIKHTELALAATPQDHPDRASMYNSMGGKLFRRFDRIGDLGDLENAIKHSKEALAAMPQDHLDRAMLHGNLGSQYFRRFQTIGDLETLQKAIKHSEEALATIPQDHPHRAGMHHNLGTQFSTRFEQIGDPGDHQQAIKHCEESVAGTPQDHPIRGVMCLTLCRYSESRLSNLHSVEDLNETLRLYREAFRCPNSPPRVRIRAAYKVATLLFLNKQFHESSSMLESAVNLMPSVNLRLLNRDDQQYILSELSGLAPIAASVALQAGKEAYHSLKLLELGRGIIMGFTIDSRSEVSELKKDHPMEYNQFHRLRVDIDSPLDTTGCPADETPEEYRNRTVSSRWGAVNEMEIILSRIRTLPGYSGFLLPPSPEDLMGMATGGPIVVFNCTSYRSDAIIVTTSAITSLELPEPSHERTGYWMGQLISFGGGDWAKRGQDNRKMKDLLIWLWDAAVGPVFDHLEPTGDIIGQSAHDTSLRRVWWIGVGQLSLAPFHAAGDHSRGSTRNTLSRAISTYIPTIKALSYARQTQLRLLDEYCASFSAERYKKTKIVKKRNLRLLLVPMAETPGAISLPGVTQEVQYICDSAFQNAIETSVLSAPTPTEVLHRAQHHDIVHFACHGVSDMNPSDSHLVLFDPDGTAASKLAAREISNMVAKNAQIAYLSACSSAKNPSVGLSDEVIHLASAFQLAGFSHTLANMWETVDHASSEVARDFNLLFQYKGSGNEHHHVSASFHEAVKKVRDQRPRDFLAWAAFVHMGA